MKDRNVRPLLDPREGTPALLRDALGAARGCLPSRADLSEIAAGLPLGRGTGGSGSDPGGETHSPGQGGGAPVAPAAPLLPSVLPGVFVGAALGAIVSVASLLWPGTAEPPRAPSADGGPTAALVAPATSAARAPASSAVDASSGAAVVRPSPAPEPRALASADASETIAPPPEPSGSAPAALVPSEAESESEAHLLRRANEALGASPAQALALTDQHIARFPGGALAQEREIVAIKALLALGRTEDARARAARFVAAHPGSAHRPGIEALLGP